jgi:hypothetical protein
VDNRRQSGRNQRRDTTPRTVHAGKQGKASTQALKHSSTRPARARPPGCSWERSNGLAALGTATINLADASASRVARLPFYCQPAAASHKLNDPPAACGTNSQAPFVPFAWRKCDKNETLHPRFTVSPSIHAPSAASLTPLLDYIQYAYIQTAACQPVPPSHRALPTLFSPSDGRRRIAHESCNDTKTRSGPTLSTLDMSPDSSPIRRD